MAATATPADLLNQYSKGDLIKAADLNAFIAAAQNTNKLWNAVGSPEALANAVRAKKSNCTNLGWFFQNISGSTVPPGGVMLPVTPTDILDGSGHTTNKPDWSCGFKPLLVNDVICDVVNNGYGTCAWAPFGVWCRIASGTPAFGERWGTTINSFELSKPGTGVFMASGSYVTISSVKYGFFYQLPEPKTFWVLNGTLSHGSNATAERIRRNSGDTAWERSGTTDTVYDLFLNVADTCETDTIISTVNYFGKNVVDAMYCAVNDWGL